ncbi:cytochrome c3 family protein [Sphingomonas sp. CGMCC 1.13654]|uniref:Cytochrome c3 family protein n=1 Tax=Sphingomonas chungangi TaxID=2683589 RepID=A0A838L6V7_9SPHN|nr:cytochrome c3 family protein [Sphingomonas chungangi]MBA2934402.1 cytochrome c3 family protein [Sphingomonas chungangi]MVW57441.1 cytochrome C [Sphingomonas chungangi]
MAQLFRPGANSIARIALLALILSPLGLVAVIVLQHTGYITGQDRFVEQTVPFSHKHHAGELGIDCRFCHVGVETDAKATVPTTEVCMTCHSQIWTNAAMLAPVRDSFASGRPLVWSRVNRLPDYVYFDHHVHVNNGVPCAACHGDLRAMPLTAQAKPMTMQWCLDCHRDPERRLVPQDRITLSRPYDPPIPPTSSSAFTRMCSGCTGRGA